jgi:hypothetical protein
MPKILTSAMRAHLDEETTRLAAIWRITRKDGVQFFFTDHDRDIVSDGEVYRADAGFERTAIRSDAGFAVDNLDLVGVFAEGGIFEDEVRAGLFDGAEIEISWRRVVGAKDDAGRDLPGQAPLALVGRRSAGWPRRRPCRARRTGTARPASCDSVEVSKNKSGSRYINARGIYNAGTITLVRAS